jgi:hypothetical protein
MLSKDRKSLQLLALMEESVAYAPWISKTYAVDYSNRYPVTYGQKLGVLTDTNNTPLQELSGLNGILDISNTTLTLKSFLSGTEFISWSGEIFADLRNIIPQRGRFWEVWENAFIIKCEYAEDITVGSYAVKACNVWAEYAWDYGSFFQWGENIAWDASTGVTGSNNCTWNRDTQSCTTPSLLSWSSTVSDTTSGGIDRWFDYGDTRWPCAPGYRVPTQTDWSAIVSAGWWGTNGSVILSALQLPLAWLRNSSGGGRLNVGSYAYLWSSSPYSPNAYVASISSSSFTSSASNNRVGWFPVRCIKN